MYCAGSLFKEVNVWKNKVSVFFLSANFLLVSNAMRMLIYKICIHLSLSLKRKIRSSRVLRHKKCLKELLFAFLRVNY